MPRIQTENIDQTRNYFIENINQDELITKKPKKIVGLNYIANLLILISKITGCVSIFSFASLVGIITGITSSEVG